MVSLLSVQFDNVCDLQDEQKLVFKKYAVSIKMQKSKVQFKVIKTKKNIEKTSRV